LDIRHRANGEKRRPRAWLHALLETMPFRQVAEWEKKGAERKSKLVDKTEEKGLSTKKEVH